MIILTAHNKSQGKVALKEEFISGMIEYNKTDTSQLHTFITMIPASGTGGVTVKESIDEILELIGGVKKGYKKRIK